jgi:LssY C-terminus
MICNCRWFIQPATASRTKRKGSSTLGITLAHCRDTHANELQRIQTVPISRPYDVRLWKQGKEDAWLSTATEDVGYKLQRMHLTHATDPLIDSERAKVLNDPAFTGCVDAATLMTRASSDVADQREHSLPVQMERSQLFGSITANIRDRCQVTLRNPFPAEEHELFKPWWP